MRLMYLLKVVVIIGRSPARRNGDMISRLRFTKPSRSFARTDPLLSYSTSVIQRYKVLLAVAFCWLNRGLLKPNAKRKR